MVGCRHDLVLTLGFGDGDARICTSIDYISMFIASPSWVNTKFIFSQNAGLSLHHHHTADIYKVHLRRKNW